MLTSCPLRLRVLDPSVGVVTGGTRLVLYGVGFRPPPHSLTVRFQLNVEADDDKSALSIDPSISSSSLPNTLDVTARFLLDTQIECIVPSFECQAKRVIAVRTSLAPSSSSIINAPQLIPLSVHVLLHGSDQQSNALPFKLHQPLEIRCVCPQSIIMTSPAVTITATLNLLKLQVQHRYQVLDEVNRLPVFVRVRQASERTKGISEQTKEGKWTLSSTGVYEVQFDAVAMSFGAATIDISLNRVDFFPGDPEACGYRVYRDVSLRAIDPPCICVTSGRVTDVVLTGNGFVDTGDIVVALYQKELVSDGNDLNKDVQVAQLNATFHSPTEVQCTIPANLPFGRTAFSVSLNGGRQFGQARVVGLLQRARVFQDTFPRSSSLTGGTMVKLRHSCLNLEDVDAFDQLQHLEPPRRIRVRFQPLNFNPAEDNGELRNLTKVVTAHASSETRGVLLCRLPSWMENLKALKALKAKDDNDSTPYLWQFTVAIALSGEDSFQGALPFSFYLPPVIRSLTNHHGPCTGDTCVKLQMKHKVPPGLELRVRFSSLDLLKSITVEGHGPCHEANGDLEAFISCQTPPWIDNLTNEIREVPHPTIVQVSYDAGATFVPAIAPMPATTPSNALPKPIASLCFLFYPPPIVHSAIPLSADVGGGSYVRIQGEYLVDYGAELSVIFESPAMSRKVAAFVQKGELRCCTPPFNVGRARIFVSLNGEQYTRCALHDVETKKAVDFVFYSSPIVTRISPLCASVHHSSQLGIFGTNFAETKHIQVRIAFPSNVQGSERRLVFKDVPGRVHDGRIIAMTPTFPEEFANLTAKVEIALNGTDFSSTSLSLRYISTLAITRIDPSLGAFEIPIVLTVYLTPVLITDRILARIRLRSSTSMGEERQVGQKSATEVVCEPLQVNSWTSDSVELVMPPLSSLVKSLSVLTTAHLDLSIDKVHFHDVGNLRDFYRVYNMPQLTSASPLFGPFDRETIIVAHGVHMKANDVVKLTLFLESSGVDTVESENVVSVPVATTIAEVNVKRQRLSWTCPSLIQLRASLNRDVEPQDRQSLKTSTHGMLFPQRVRIQISCVDGQALPMPFVFHYYRAPLLVAMTPRAGYVCKGSLVSFEFAERIDTPTVEFRFGNSFPVAGRIRNERLVECFSPELSPGSHNVRISFNRQHYETAILRQEPSKDTESSSIASFRAFPLPVFLLPPPGQEHVYAFGPTCGGTSVVIKGRGFDLETKIYVRFASSVSDAFHGKAHVIVSAKVVDTETITCISPPSLRIGRVKLHVSYNLQQFIDSTCCFEYHALTRYVSRGTLCGSTSGHTCMTLGVQDTKGLPSLLQLLQCVVRFESERLEAPRHAVDIVAAFDPETNTLSCMTPSWPSNELVGLRVSLSQGENGSFEDTRIKFLFYDPPKGLIQIEPCAGPIRGGTRVLVDCGSIVDVGDIRVSIQVKTERLKTKEDHELIHEASNASKALDSVVVRGEIVGEAMCFVTPSVDRPCTALLSISVNGITYTSTQSPLHFRYYVEPILARLHPGWASVDADIDTLVLEGEHICDYGCSLLVRFALQDDPRPEANGIIVAAQFLPKPSTCATKENALRCVIPSIRPGFYELEVSLNGQQFSASRYANKAFGSFCSSLCTALPPFRYFSSPFCLATATGPAAGGSTVVLFLSRKLRQLLSRESKCQVQFTLVQKLVPPASSSPRKIPTTSASDSVSMTGEIDHLNACVTCKAPLLRVACVSFVDIIVPSSHVPSSASQLFGVRHTEREKFYSYESPSITKIIPSCGPTSGGTQLVLEGVNVLDTAQIFVRFRSSINEKEFVLVPARYSCTYPSGLPSTLPLIICTTPSLEFIEPALETSALVHSQVSSSFRRGDGTAASKSRTQAYQLLAEQSLKAHRASSDETITSEVERLKILRITRPIAKTTARVKADNDSGTKVLVDFTLNAGEQFIAHSVRFHYYQDLEPHHVKWSPRHLPAQYLNGRQARNSQQLTLTLPKTFKLNDSPEHICVRFDNLSSSSSKPRQRSSSLLQDGTCSDTQTIVPDQGTKRQPRASVKTSSQLSDNEKDAMPESDSPGSSACIAAKVVSANEVSCLVPDLLTPGAVQVLFSLNAQQFVRLGELFVHLPMRIQDTRHRLTFRFCSSIGGSVFRLQCSRSTVLNYLAPEDMITEEKTNVAMHTQLGIKQDSVALAQAQAKTLQHLAQVAKRPGGTESHDDAFADKSCGTTLDTWQKRSSYCAQAVLIPSNIKLLKRVVVEATRVGNQSEMEQMSPDEDGNCVFDTVNWEGQVLLSATLPSSCSYSSYSTVIEPVQYGATTTSTNSYSQSHLAMILLPVSSNVHVAVVGHHSVQSSVFIVDADGQEIADSIAILSEPESYQHVVTYCATLEQTKCFESCDVCYVCVRFERIDKNKLHSSYTHATARFQVLIADCSGIQLCRCGPPADSAVWIVGRLSKASANASSSPPAVEAVDLLVDTSPNLPSSIKVALTELLESSKPSTTLSCPSSSVSMAFTFTSTDSPRAISISSHARLVLPPSASLESFSPSSHVTKESSVTLECIMPSLSFNGPATLAVTCGGIAFSNNVLVHCYDPRSWRVLALNPSCCQLPSQDTKDSLTLCLQGENFVENRRITIRLTNKDQVLTIAGKVAQVHVLRIRIAAVKNLRCLLQPLGIGGHTPSTNTIEGGEGTSASGSTKALISTSLPFTLTLCIECGAQRLYASCRDTSVFAALSSGSVLSWDEAFEVRIASDRQTPLFVTAQVSEPSMSQPLELAQAWIPLDDLQEGSFEAQRCTVRFQEHFTRGPFAGSDVPVVATNDVVPELELLLQLSPLVLHSEHIVGQIPNKLLATLSPQALDVQVSSGDGFYSSPRTLLMYNRSTVTNTSPCVLPRSSGGEVLVTGTGFVPCGHVHVRLFAFKKNRFNSDDEEQRALTTINKLQHSQQTKSATPSLLHSFFTRNVEGIFISTTSLKFRMPSYLTTYNVYYSVSFDGWAFTEASQFSNVLLFSTSAVTPKGGPISGNTYTTLHGVNIAACLTRRSGLTPLVRVAWKSGARDLEQVLVSAEFYPPEDAVYFYIPQSKFGLHSIAVNVELALVSSSAKGTTLPHFGRDEVLFVMYKQPTIKSITPQSALISGLSTTEVLVQGFEEKAITNLRLAPKLRFKRRGQMQVSDAQLVSDTRFECVVPRFNVTNATALELSSSVMSKYSSLPKLRSNGGISQPRRAVDHAKLWTRTAGIFVTLLGARNLRASKRNTCNPFAVIYVGKTQLKSTRKDGVFAPVWNELFDFEWTWGTEAATLAPVRVALENQVTNDQSESLGHVELTFPFKDSPTQAFAFRAWLPLRRIRGKHVHKDKEDRAGKLSKHRQSTEGSRAISALGEVELAIAFAPPKVELKKPKKNVLQSSIMSVLSAHSQLSKKPGQSSNRRDRSYQSKKDKLLRAFRQRGAPLSFIPTELTVDLALNGQDFWSIAPSTCLSVLTPLVANVEPKFISITGGTTLHLSGSNFINSGCLRVAFVVLGNDKVIQSERILVVDAKYRSSTHLVCTTPSLLNLVSTIATVLIYVSLNGTDFDSIALPKLHTKRSEALVCETENENDLSQRSAAKDEDIITLADEQYVVDCAKVSLTENFVLVPQVQVFLTPQIKRFGFTDGTYTSHLTIEGTHFTNTGIALARFTSKTSTPEVRMAKLLVMSSTRMECNVPDFARGTIVCIAIAMNGVEFIQCPGELCVFQVPRLTEIFPTCVSSSTTLELELRGINLMAATIDTSTPSVHVSFSGSHGRKIVRGLCEGGQVRCPIPKEILHVPTLESQENGTPRSVISPILVDIWLGEKHNTLTNSSLPLHVYREIPKVHAVSPLDGPVYGGFVIVVEGRDFLDTGKIVVRFQLESEQQQGTTSSTDEHVATKVQPSSTIKRVSIIEKRQDASASNKLSNETIAEPLTPVYVDVVAKFVSGEQILCPAPLFPQEGVYKVLVALNSVEFSRVSDGSWFLAWQNWHKRKRLPAHARSPRLMISDEASTAPAIVEAAASVVMNEKDTELLRSKSSLVLPKIKSTTTASPVEPSSTVPKSRNVNLQSEATSYRSKSPEPGPTHYDPRYNMVSSRETAAIILPPAVQFEHHLDPLSTSFINYDATVQAVKPRPPRQVFRKQKFNISWCNPVVKNATALSPRPPMAHHRAQPGLSARVEETSSAQSSEVMVDVATAATESKTNQDGVNDDDHKGDEKVDESQAASESSKSQTSKEDVVRTPRTPVQATIDKRTDRPNTSFDTSVTMPYETHLTGSNPFYNDIAPLYAKILNSSKGKKIFKQ